jgi:hypothetical protein
LSLTLVLKHSKQKSDKCRRVNFSFQNFFDFSPLVKRENKGCQNRNETQNSPLSSQSLQGISKVFLKTFSTFCKLKSTPFFEKLFKISRKKETKRKVFCV